MQGSIVQRYTVPGDDFGRVGDASSLVKKSLKQLGFPSDVIRRVAVALYEGEINMAIHASGGEITVEIFPDRIRMELSDCGPGIGDLELAMKEGYSTAPDHARDMGFGAGMGLPNMRKCCDEFELESEVGVGTTVRMSIENQRV